jgi:hypothetical protein
VSLGVPGVVPVRRDANCKEVLGAHVLRVA